MYAQATLKRNIIPHNVAHRIVNRGVQKCTCAGASLRSKKCVPLNCINLDTATDPACGAGCMLIAAAAAYQNEGPAPRNYQTDIMFAAQDVDRVVAMMCYIHLSLLGCAGYVIVGDSLRDPPCGNALFPIVGEHNEIWYTPMWNSPLWIARRIRQLPIWDPS